MSGIERRTAACGAITASSSTLAASSPKKWAWASHIPGMTVSVELHRGTVVDPLTALVAFAEDAVEVARARFDHVLVPFDVTAATPAPSAGSDGAAVVPSRPALAALIEILGDPSRLWLMHVVEAPTPPTFGPLQASRAAHETVPGAAGILHVPSRLALP